MRATWLLLVMAGCQCLEPVDEFADAGVRRDAGVDAGRDAGVDAGARECTKATDCPARDAGASFCGAFAMSCVDGRCVAECPSEGPRTCTRSGQCLSCDGGAAECVRCSAGSTCRGFSVDGEGCPAPFFDGAIVSVDPRCGGAITLDGGFVGTWVGDFDQQSSLIELPGLGGTCLGRDLFTGVSRTLISCPACTFVAFGCD